MTERQMLLVKESWQLVLDNQQEVASAFYEKLFQLNPDLRSMFTKDMRHQGLKLMAMLTMVVQSLPDFDDIQDELKVLSKLHAQVYEVTPEDYDTVGQALLITLQTGLGDRFTPELKEAWTLAYGNLAAKMKEWGFYYDGAGLPSSY